MDETVEPFDSLDSDGIEREIEKAIRNPEETDFRPEEPESLNLDSLTDFDEVTVDMRNRNISVKYPEQRDGEKYTVLKGNKEFGFIESRAIIEPSKGNSEMSTSYYLVTPENVLFYMNDGYIETPLSRPREVYRCALGILENLDLENIDKFKPASELEKVGQGGKPVPPPENYDPLSDLR